MAWSDSFGNAWIFGGIDYTYMQTNDLWKYVASTNQWTWVTGSSVEGDPGIYGVLGAGSTSYTPGARNSSASWIDSAGTLWLWGGFGFDSADASGYLNDLWKFVPTTGQWFWISGSSSSFPAATYGVKGVGSTNNIPGGRYNPSSWIDSSNILWFFGGGVTGTALNDLWKFNPLNRQWTWVSGSSSANQSGNYGTLGISSGLNVPGARSNSASWIDASGNFWLFGGYGLDSTGAFGNLNDLWQYSPTSNRWTWMGGSNLINQVGVFGTQGVGALSNIPSALFSPLTWKDSSGNLWLLGGTGIDSSGTSGTLNTVWEYSPTSGMWTWMSGSNLVNQVGIYGTKGATTPTSIPGSRTNGLGWMDVSGNFWMFGGTGYDNAGDFGYLNDLWKIVP